MRPSAVQFGAGRQKGRVHREPAHRVERRRQQGRSKNNDKASRKGKEKP